MQIGIYFGHLNPYNLNLYNVDRNRFNILLTPSFRIHVCYMSANEKTFIGIIHLLSKYKKNMNGTFCFLICPKSAKENLTVLKINTPHMFPSGSETCKAHFYFIINNYSAITGQA